MDHIETMNRLMREVLSLQETLGQIGMFDFAQRSDVQRRIDAKRIRYTALAEKHADTLLLQRTCRKCRNSWRVRPHDVAQVHQEATDFFGGLAGVLTGQARGREQLRADAIRLNTCPKCRSPEFTEEWVSADT